MFFNNFIFKLIPCIVMLWGNSYTAGVSQDTMFSILKYQHNSIDKTMDKDHVPLIVYGKMTTLANPNHMVIGQLVYDELDDGQKSLFQQLDFSPAIWSYNNNNNGKNIYKVYTNI